MIVVAILGLLIVILQDSYSRWSRRYRVESEAKTLHTYVLDARSRAITRYRAQFVRTGGATYSIVDDTNPPPDGNGADDVGVDNVVYVGSVAPDTILATVPNPLVFGRDGTAQGSGYIRIVSDVPGAQYDCIDVGPTRIRVGLFNGTLGICQPR